MTSEKRLLKYVSSSFARSPARRCSTPTSALRERSGLRSGFPRNTGDTLHDCSRFGSLMDRGATFTVPGGQDCQHLVAKPFRTGRQMKVGLVIPVMAMNAVGAVVREIARLPARHSSLIGRGEWRIRDQICRLLIGRC